MDRDTWQRVKKILDRALLLADDERPAFLERACAGDEGIRREVESLLARQDRNDASRDVSAAVRESAESWVGELSAVGPYRPLRRVGEGGMGEVWLAEQDVPIRRTVALKLIRRGMDSEGIVARFENERQALAMMDHPHVAKVLDAGTATDGRPYFVMEYVDGVPITQYCRDHDLAVRERLELFLQVCHGIHHAHQRAVIHRDIKPSNVLVAEHDDTPVVKIIDFGIAKALDEPVGGGGAARTARGLVLGTPEYMSPEQARGASNRVDTRTDVYALGILLYELLTGDLPVERERFRSADAEAIRRAIYDTSPAKPSARVRTAGGRAREEQAFTVSARDLRGDLDVIVMKALEKSPERRFESAHQLAEDIARHLRSEPILARPASAGYRISRFVRRHRTLSAAVVVLSLVVAAFVTALSIQSVEIARERDTARYEARVAQRVTDFMVDLFTDTNPYRLGSAQVSSDELLRRGMARIDSVLEEDARVGMRLMLAIGNAYYGLSRHDDATAMADRILQTARANGIEPDDRVAVAALSLRGSSATRQGRYEESARDLERALELVSDKREEEPYAVLVALESLTDVYCELGRFEEAAVLAEDRLALALESGEADDRALAFLSLARVRSERRGTGDLERAIELSGRAYEIAASLYSELDTRMFSFLDARAVHLASAGRIEDAAPLFERALAIAESVGNDLDGLGFANYNNGILKRDLGDYEGARERLLRAEALWTECFEDPDHSNNAWARRALGEVEEKLGRLKDAETSFLRAVEIADKAWSDEHLQRVNTILRLAAFYVRQGRSGDARPYSTEALAILGRRARAPEADMRDKIDYANTLIKLEPAQDLSRTAILEYVRSVESDAEETREPRTFFYVGKLHESLRSTDDAVRCYSHALSLASENDPIIPQIEAALDRVRDAAV